MSGLEPIVAAEVVGPAIAAEVGTAAVVDAVIAETVAAEIAAEATRQAALNQFAASAGESLLAGELGAQEFIAQEALKQQALENFGQSASEILANQAPTFQDAAFQNMLRYGMDADMPGATTRSIQAGLRNAPLNTLTSLPQYMGMPAMPQGSGQALQAARLLSPQQEGGTRTSVSPPMLNRGKEVSLAAPVLGLLGGAPMPKRRRLSLI